MKTFIRYLGYLLIISAFFRIVPIITAFYFGEASQSFFFVAGISLVLGGGLVLMANKCSQLQRRTMGEFRHHL